MTEQNLENMIIKPKGTMRVTDGKTHMPSEIRSEITSREIAYISDAKTAVLFDPDTNASDIVKSLKLLIKDIDLRLVKRQFEDKKADKNE